MSIRSPGQWTWREALWVAATEADSASQHVRASNRERLWFSRLNGGAFRYSSPNATHSRGRAKMQLFAFELADILLVVGDPSANTESNADPVKNFKVRDGHICEDRSRSNTLDGCLRIMLWGVETMALSPDPAETASTFQVVERDDRL
jgi:hypothetical protein